MRVFYSATTKKNAGENYISCKWNTVKVIWMCLPSSYRTQFLPHLTLIYKTNPFISRISLFHRAFQFTMCNGPTNALVCNKTLIQMSHIKTFKTLKITPTCFSHQLIIIREVLILVKIIG
jgi:hypothetical protein